jgi:hypothetical protein
MWAFLSSLVGAIPAAATSKPGLTAFAITAAVYIATVWRVSRNKQILANLQKLPPEDRLRGIAATGGRKYTAGNIDRRKYQRLVALGWLTEVSVNISDVLYEVTDAGKAAALRDD